MRYYIIAGEASGDLHASNLIKEINLLDKKTQFRCWGGDLMQNQGAEIVKHYKNLAFMGFIEVLMNVRTIFKNIKFCKKDIVEYKPDVVILVDYPGFNFKIAKFCKQTGLKVFYYISPQLWAWKQSRVKKIKKFVDNMFVILPFEEKFYKSYNYKVDFVGHPLFDAIAQVKFKKFEIFVKENNLNDKPVIALVPGSRRQEIIRMLSKMLSIIPYYKDYQFVIAGVSSVSVEFYKHIIKDLDVEIIYNNTYELFMHSKAALVTSGTATLEAALFEVPEVVCYKSLLVSYLLAKFFVGSKIKFISLVNLIMDKQVVAELIQKDFNTKNLKKELDKIIYDKEHKKILLNDYKKLKKKLGGKGASAKAAKLMIEYLRKENV